MSARSYLAEFSPSGLTIAIGAYGTLMVINLLTLALGRSEVLTELNRTPAGAVLAPLVFDSWGTLAGLGGVVLLFSPVLFGTPVAARRNLSVFFVAAGISIGILAALLWDAFYDNTPYYGSGGSSMAISAQAVVFALAIVGIVRLARQDTRRLGPLSSHWWYSFLAIYVTLILTTLWFVLSLEPIFIPTLLYNWRAHEIGFLLAVAVTFLYAGANWRGLGLDGVVRIDEMLLNFHYDDLCSGFPVRLPKYHVGFGEDVPRPWGEFDPDRALIRVSSSFMGRDYREDGRDLEEALLHAMVHAELFLEGKPWAHGLPETKAAFDEIAGSVGANPEP